MTPVEVAFLESSFDVLYFVNRFVDVVFFVVGVAAAVLRTQYHLSCPLITVLSDIISTFERCAGDWLSRAPLRSSACPSLRLQDFIFNLITARFDETTGLWMYSLSGMFKIYLRGWFFVDAVRCLVLEVLGAPAPPMPPENVVWFFGFSCVPHRYR